MKFNTKTIHGGQQPDLAYGSVMPPIYQTSTYAQHQEVTKAMNILEVQIQREPL